MEEVPVWKDENWMAYTMWSEEHTLFPAIWQNTGWVKMATLPYPFKSSLSVQVP